jgi:hypothetical protein
MQGMYAVAINGQHPGWEVLQQHIARNMPEYIIFMGAVAVAAVCTMPKKAPLIPETSPLQELWNWLRDTLQTAVPAARARHESSSQSTVETPNSKITQEASASSAIDPQPPLVSSVDPAQEKKQ